MAYICKNVCSKKGGIGKTWEQRQRPYRKAKHEIPDNRYRPFDTHGRCRTCQAWQRKGLYRKCICCGSKLSLKPRENSKKRKYQTAPRFVSSV